MIEIKGGAEGLAAMVKDREVVQREGEVAEVTGSLGQHQRGLELRRGRLGLACTELHDAQVDPRAGLMGDVSEPLGIDEVRSEDRPCLCKRPARQHHLAASIPQLQRVGRDRGVRAITLLAVSQRALGIAYLPGGLGGERVPGLGKGIITAPGQRSLRVLQCLFGRARPELKLGQTALERGGLVLGVCFGQSLAEGLSGGGEVPGERLGFGGAVEQLEPQAPRR